MAAQLRHRPAVWFAALAICAGGARAAPKFPNSSTSSSAGGGGGGGGNFTRVPLGDRLLRDYTVYAPMPITAAAAVGSGWFREGRGECVPGLGVRYSQSRAGSTPAKPLRLYFTPHGQLAGVGVAARLNPRSAPSMQLIERGFFQTESIGWDGWFTAGISLTFRPSTDVCANRSLPLALGDRIVINAAHGPGQDTSKPALAREIPLTRAEAAAAGWVAGSCFSGMGTHWYKDLTADVMTWYAANLLPVVPMYDEQEGGAGNINAVFFTTADRQQSLFPLPSSNQWEPVALINALVKTPVIPHEPSRFLRRLDFEWQTCWTTVCRCARTSATSTARSTTPRSSPLCTSTSTTTPKSSARAAARSAAARAREGRRCVCVRVCVCAWVGAGGGKSGVRTLCSTMNRRLCTRPAATAAPHQFRAHPCGSAETARTGSSGFGLGSLQCCSPAHSMVIHRHDQDRRERSMTGK